MAETFYCSTHTIALQVDDNKNRIFQTPQGSWARLPRCKLLMLNPVVEGEYSDCKIVKQES